MTDDKQPLRGEQILQEGLDDWRLVLGRLVAQFDTGDFDTGARLVLGIAEAADEMNHHPDVDLRYPHLTVTMSSHDVGAITQRDVRLARRISELAREAGVSAGDPPELLELALDTPDREEVKPFWQAVLGYAPHPEQGDQLDDKDARKPAMWFQDSDSQAADRQRWHLDVSVAHDVAEARVRAVIDAGGRLVDDSRAPAFWVLEDAQGNRACICTWQNRD